MLDFERERERKRVFVLYLDLYSFRSIIRPINNNKKRVEKNEIYIYTMMFRLKKKKHEL